MSGNNVYADLFRSTKPLLEGATRKRILSLLAKNSCTVIKAQASLVLEYLEDGQRLCPAGSYNISTAYEAAATKDIAVARAACEQKKMVLIKDIRKLYQTTDKKIARTIAKEGLVSLVAAPMIHDGDVIGCINIYFTRSIQRLDAKDTLNTLVSVGALALHHVCTLNALEKEREVTKILHEAGVNIALAKTSEEITLILLRATLRTLSGESSYLLMFDEIDKSAGRVLEYDPDARALRSDVKVSRLDDEIYAKFMRKRGAVIETDANLNVHMDPITLEKAQGAVVGVPLAIRDRALGVLFANCPTPSELTERNIGCVSALAGQAAVALDNLTLSRKATREDKETMLLYEVSQSLISTLDFNQLLKNVLQRLKETFGFLNISVLLIDEDKQALYTHSSIVYSREDRDLRLRIGYDGITGHVAQTRRMYYSPDVSKDTYYVTGIADTKSEVCFPLLTGDRLIGVLDVESSDVNGFSQDVIRLLSSLSAQIAIAIDNARLYEETKRLSMTDPLTGMSNRRSFEFFVEAEIRRAERYRRTFVLMMIDFDNFKNYNDQYGHMAGDIVLQKLSKIMKEIIRDVDFLCRYGGDEFVVVLPETDASFALDVAERMRKKIASQKIQPKITLSIGIASFPHDAREKSRLIDLADQACYEAKQRGGNRVIFTFKPKDSRQA